MPKEFAFTLPMMWRWWFRGIWTRATGKAAHHDKALRCRFCKRRLEDNQMVSFLVRKPLDEKAEFFTVCLNHGDYDGQKITDCFTGVEMTLKKELALYRQLYGIHEIAFYVNTIKKVIRLFFGEIFYQILYSADWILRKALQRQEERLGYK